MSGSALTLYSLATSIKTDRQDNKRLSRLHRAGVLAQMFYAWVEGRIETAPESCVAVIGSEGSLRALPARPPG